MKKAAEFLSGLTSVRHPSRQPTSHGKLSRVSSRTMAETHFALAWSFDEQQVEKRNLLEVRIGRYQCGVEFQRVRRNPNVIGWDA